MNAVFLTTDDPIYLPAFFDRVLEHNGASTRAVYVTAPLFKKQTPWQATLRFARTFGVLDAMGLAQRVVEAKLKGRSIAASCRRRNVPCETILDVNAPEFLDRLRQLEPDVLISVSCPQIFKKPLIDLSPRGILNIHGALLPRYRGVMPSFWMLSSGDRRAGVSIYFVNEKIDAGELCGQREFDILPDDSLHSFLVRSKAVAADLLLEVLGKMENGTVTRVPLNLAEGSYHSWPNAEAVRKFRAKGRRLWS